MYIVRCSRPEVFCIKDVLKNTAKFTEKRLGPSLFLHNISGLRFAILLTLIWVVVVVVVGILPSAPPPVDFPLITQKQ